VTHGTWLAELENLSRMKKTKFTEMVKHS